MNRIRSYDYVNRPFPEVSEALSAHPLEIFQAATKTAAERANSLASELSIDVAGIKLGADIAIKVTATAETNRCTELSAMRCPITALIALPRTPSGGS